MELLKDWDPICTAIVEKTPSLVDWKLVYRDPLPTWVSKKRRVLLLGDSAHPFLPTSAQGGTQAMEDGATLAVCLRRAGKEHVQAALKTHEEIRFVVHSILVLKNDANKTVHRYERVKAIQKTGETTRDTWHKTDWDTAKKNPASLALPKEDWIHHHDAEAHAETVFDEVFKKHST